VIGKIFEDIKVEVVWVIFSHHQRCISGGDRESALPGCVGTGFTDVGIGQMAHSGLIKSDFNNNT
jgi:hypothetical protein